MYTKNQITIIGFPGFDAEAHDTQNGTVVVRLSVATKASWKDADGSWQSRTDWHRIVTFDQPDFAAALARQQNPKFVRNVHASEACSKHYDSLAMTDGFVFAFEWPLGSKPSRRARPLPSRLRSLRQSFYLTMSWLHLLRT